MLQHESSIGLKDDSYSSADTSVAEIEVRRLLMARVDGWLEWAVGWMDFRDDDNDDEDDVEDDDAASDAGQTSVTVTVTATAPHDPDNQSQQGITEMSIGEETARPNSATITATTVSESGPDGLNADKTESQNGALSPPPPPPPPPSSLWTGGVPDIWWGDAKWLFSVAGRVAW